MDGNVDSMDDNESIESYNNNNKKYKQKSNWER